MKRATFIISMLILIIGFVFGINYNMQIYIPCEEKDPELCYQMLSKTSESIIKMITDFLETDTTGIYAIDITDPNSPKELFFLNSSNEFSVKSSLVNNIFAAKAVSASVSENKFLTLNLNDQPQDKMIYSDYNEKDFIYVIGNKNGFIILEVTEEMSSDELQKASYSFHSKEDLPPFIENENVLEMELSSPKIKEKSPKISKEYEAYFSDDITVEDVIKSLQYYDDGVDE